MSCSATKRRVQMQYSQGRAPPAGRKGECMQVKKLAPEMQESAPGKKRRCKKRLPSSPVPMVGQGRVKGQAEDSISRMEDSSNEGSACYLDDMPIIEEIEEQGRARTSGGEYERNTAELARISEVLAAVTGMVK
ncbi:Hypothetical predicted protein, partial [Pelobates cultripes]